MNKLPIALLALLGTLQGCQFPSEKPTPAQIESTAMTASQRSEAAAERKLIDWAAQGMPVAQRELGLIYANRPRQRGDALTLFERAARAGDIEAAFQLGEMLRIGVVGVPAAPGQAWPWYKLAARGNHAKAALVLGMLYKNGDGVPRDDAESARWLALSSKLGNPHAMFLLSNAVNEGRGVPRDLVKGRALLEESAEHEYPPAIQELAMAMQTGDALSSRDTLRASHLLKEATEHRHNNWNRF